jgi:hypothetical protein
MALPPHQFSPDDVEPIDTNVARVQGTGQSAISARTAVFDVTAGRYVSRAWRVTYPDLPADADERRALVAERRRRDEEEHGPGVLGPHVLDHERWLLEVFITRPKPGHVYEVEMAHGSLRFRVGTEIRLEDPGEARYESPRQYMGWVPGGQAVRTGWSVLTRPFRALLRIGAKDQHTDEEVP